MSNLAAPVVDKSLAVICNLQLLSTGNVRVQLLLHSPIPVLADTVSDQLLRLNQDTKE